MSNETARADQLAGVLLGTAVGDALGLPYEGMSRRRARKTMGGAPLRHRFLAGRGMVSDDTEHACMLGYALARSQGDVPRFQRALGWQLRYWLLGAPAGIGFGTLRAVIRLWLGFSPLRSGVRSAGNGPAMRAPLLGAYAADNPALLRALVAASTRITHVDPRAEAGALAVAHAAALGARQVGGSPTDLIAMVRDSLEPCEMAELLHRASERADVPAEVFADELGLGKGITGFVNHTVPVVVHVWARHRNDLGAALTEVIRLGGDTDTTAAIVGGMIGAGTGAAGVPGQWLDGLLEWPRGPAWMRRLAASLANGAPPPGMAWPWVLPRNALFTAGVFSLLGRRLLPPW